MRSFSPKAPRRPHHLPDDARLMEHDRASWGTLLILLPVAASLYAVRGRGQWFFQDEWEFLSRRDGGSLDGLLIPHNEHWSTLPVIAYRGLWNVVGLQHYWPYQAVTIGLHLVIVVLVRAVMGRTGVAPWTATLGAALLLFYGSGSENVIWAFQIGFSGSLTFGLAHLILADDTRPSRRRQAAGLVCGAAALMCSGIGLVMVGVVGLATLLRHGWRAASVQTAPLAGLYLLWWATYGRRADRAVDPRAEGVPAFVGRGISHALRDVSQRPIVAVALVVVVVVGIGLRVRAAGPRWSAVGRDLGLPVALGVGALVFFTVSGTTRAADFGAIFATHSRYSHVAMTLLVVGIAVGCDAVIRRWRRATIPVVVLLLAGVPGNIAAIETRQGTPPATILAVAASDALASAPPSLSPFPGVVGDRNIRVDWLRAAVRAGKVPLPRKVPPAVEAEALARLTLVLDDQPAATAECTPLLDEQTVELDPGQTIGFRGSVRVWLRSPSGGEAQPFPATSREEGSLTVVGSPVTLRFDPDFGVPPAELCRPPAP